ncbi:MAG: polysaccharide deacetylase family protein [Pseudomonadota bacterium]|nr:polysaccharide deacetylase family protein [Pseudomonadota bacterium]
MLEFRSRVDFWRLLRLFQQRELPLTMFACALTLERMPNIADAIQTSGADVRSHGWRWAKHFEISL